MKLEGPRIRWSRRPAPVPPDRTRLYTLAERAMELMPRSSRIPRPQVLKALQEHLKATCQAEGDPLVTRCPLPGSEPASLCIEGQSLGQMTVRVETKTVQGA